MIATGKLRMNIYVWYHNSLLMLNAGTKLSLFPPNMYMYESCNIWNSRLSSYCRNTVLFPTITHFDTSGENDQLINLIFNGVKSHFPKIIYHLDIHI